MTPQDLPVFKATLEGVNRAGFDAGKLEGVGEGLSKGKWQGFALGAVGLLAVLFFLSSIVPPNNPAPSNLSPSNPKATASTTDQDWRNWR